MILPALIAGMLSSTSVAQDVPDCFPRADLAAALAGKFHETPIAVGLATGGIVELFAAADGATWTLVVSRPNGISCIIGGGQKWQAVPQSGTSL